MGWHDADVYETAVASIGTAICFGSRVDVSMEVGAMVSGRVGDRVILESQRTGQAPREGDILEVLGVGESLHYRVRWDNGHESTFFSSGGSITVIHKATKARVPKAPTR